MREIKRSALVAQSPSRLFEIINDVESYPRFIPWCTHAKVQSRSAREIVATVGVQRGPLRSEFTTRNELEPDRRIVMHLVSGPFKMLEGEWLLSPIAAAAPVGTVGSSEAPGIPDPGATIVPQPVIAGASSPSPNAVGGGCRIQLN